MANRDIFMTEEDHDRLTQLLEGARQRRHRDLAHVEQLDAELDRAHIVAAADIPPDVVTMNSQVALRDLDTGAEIVLTLVFPHQANVDQQKVSVRSERLFSVIGAVTSSNGTCPLVHGAYVSTTSCISLKPRSTKRSSRWANTGLYSPTASSESSPRSQSWSTSLCSLALSN